MEEGPFTKDHAIFIIIKEYAKENDTVMGFQYENEDHYARVWFETMDGANAMRTKVNKNIGWPILSNSELVDVDDGVNPFTRDAVAIEVFPRKYAEKLDSYNYNLAAYLVGECEKKGVNLRLS